MGQEVKSLEGKSVAILATNGFEEIELSAPLEELKSLGADVKLVSDKPSIRSWKNRKWGSEYNVDIMLDGASEKKFDALILPGGVINPDRLRRNEKAIEFIKEFDEKNKLIAAICHGPQLLIETDIAKNKKLTSFFSIKTDLENAGAQWEDSSVVVDNNLITSRNPDDIPNFLKKVIARLKIMN